MKTFLCWLDPSPGYDEHGNLYPISTKLYFISSQFNQSIPDNIPQMVAFILTEAKVDELLRHDAELWSWFKTGDERRPERFDEAHADKLFAAYKAKLAETGSLDFTKPCAGVRV